MAQKGKETRKEGTRMNIDIEMKYFKKYGEIVGWEAVNNLIQVYSLTRFSQKTSTNSSRLRRNLLHG